MANYAYVGPIQPALTIEGAREIITSAVRDLLGERFKVVLADWQDDGPVFFVHVPNSATTDESLAMVRGCAAGEDVGFAVALQKHRDVMTERSTRKGQRLAFRHFPCGEFARWAQGCLEEELAERLKLPLEYDAGPTTYKPGHCWYRKGKTFRKHLLHHDILKPGDKPEYVDRYARSAPEGFWP